MQQVGEPSTRKRRSPPCTTRSSTPSASSSSTNSNSPTYSSNSAMSAATSQKQRVGPDVAQQVGQEVEPEQLGGYASTGSEPCRSGRGEKVFYDPASLIVHDTSLPEGHLRLQQGRVHSAAPVVNIEDHVMIVGQLLQIIKQIKMDGHRAAQAAQQNCRALQQQVSTTVTENKALCAAFNELKQETDLQHSNSNRIIRTFKDRHQHLAQCIEKELTRHASTADKQQMTVERCTKCSTLTDTLMSAQMCQTAALAKVALQETMIDSILQSARNERATTEILAEQSDYETPLLCRTGSEEPEEQIARWVRRTEESLASPVVEAAELRRRVSFPVASVQPLRERRYSTQVATSKGPTPAQSREQRFPRRPRYLSETEVSSTQGLTINLSANCNPQQQQSHASPVKEAAETVLRQVDTASSTLCNEPGSPSLNPNANSYGPASVTIDSTTT